MRVRTVMMFACSAFALSTAAYAEEVATAAETTEAATAQTSADEAVPANEKQETVSDQDIVVTARKREEALKDVPVAVTAITGETLEKRGLDQVKDVAQLTPSLNINSDSVGRVFLAIRGVGTTLVGTVQPGVGIFVDGIYQPNTSYLNNPMVDVQRVEVLRGPQGTLYGKNTLGGAISVVTRQPSNELRIHGGASYAGPDDAWNVFGSVSGPIVNDRLQVRVAAAHQQEDGFIRNKLLGTDANGLNIDSINTTIRAVPIGDVVLTFNGYYDWVKGGNIPYSHIDGPKDYSRGVYLNAENTIYYDYKGANAKLQVPVAEGHNLTLVGAYDKRDGRNPDLDIDFNPVDIGRQESTDSLQTVSTELRLDSQWSGKLSTLFGLYYSDENLKGRSLGVVHGVHPIFGPITVVSGSVDRRNGESLAAFGNLFWKPTESWEAAFGLRVDREDRYAEGDLGQTILFGTVDLPDAPDVPLTTPVDRVKIKSTKWLPKFTLTRHWTPDFMSYASISRGYRGGGFNGPTAPFRTYKGDSAWTYELGTKYSSNDRRLSVTGALFYNDYKDYIGLNQFVLGTDGRAATVDLNTGDVESYGAEIEVAFRPLPDWTLTGGASYVHARIENSDIYTELTGKHLASDRLPFQPDWTFNINSDYVVPIGRGDLDFYAGVFAKGSRIGASISETRAPVLPSYMIVNTALTYNIGKIEVGAFVDNLFDKKYYNSFIEKTTLENVFGPGPLASDLGISADRRRYGIRTRFKL
jgi:iron complex outermembrane receptor protein